MTDLRIFLLLPLLVGGVASASPSSPKPTALFPEFNDAVSILVSVSEASDEAAASDSSGEILVVDRYDRQRRRAQRQNSRSYQDNSYRFQFQYRGDRDDDHRDWDHDRDDDDWDDDDDDHDRRHYYYRSSRAPYGYYSQPRYYYYGR